MLRPEVLEALMVDLHSAIAKESRAFVRDIQIGKADTLCYPPDVESRLSRSERAALGGVAASPSAERALRKLFEDRVASILFSFFCQLDGVGAPEDCEEWQGVTLSEGEDLDAPLYHDEFYATYERYEARMSALSNKPLQPTRAAKPIGKRATSRRGPRG